MKQVIYLGATEGYEATKAALEGVAKVQHVAAEQPDVAAALRTADGLLDASMKTRITDDMVSAAPNLKIISCATTGSDHIARAALDARGIPVRTLKEDPNVLRNITPAAEHSWALLMACARKLPAAVSHVTGGGWTREDFPGVMLKGKRLGLVGCGRIGGWMSRYANAFGMEVIGFDPHLANFPDTISPRSLEEVVTTSDFVSIHVHLSPETEGLVSRELVEKMKPSAILINTSRGGIVDEAALYDAIESGHLGGAGLDVLKGEPDTTDHPLVILSRTHPNLLITPHCGGFSPDAVRLVCTHAAGKIRKTLQGAEP
ncbi:NAD(P)-dependent oxidoreductase [Pseudorhodoplanes sinuspersici]|nr:NAD(P)-dependent oxidoreductase [Pseudorhodoplanes sinuspersici]RKE72316.1 D-3-phosphoglycerate dehydrogenase [Pseudorhodoplanes sinuspersici]